MQYTIEELRQKIFSHVLDVYAIFQNHYGEAFTDLQGLPTTKALALACSYDPAISISDGAYSVPRSSLNSLVSHYARDLFSIYVYWPHITVSNEYDKSIDISDLYARVDICLDGRIPYENWGVLWNRSRYTSAQFVSNYMHSHIHDIPKDNFSRFQEPCLGSASIKDTIISLKSSSDVALWMLFCEELSRAVTVESIAGHPWKRLEQVGEFKPLYGYAGFTPSCVDVYSHIYDANYSHHNSPYWLKKDDFYHLLKSFIAYYLSHGHLSFCFQYGRFCVGLSYFDFMVDISNAFISFYNQTLSGDSDKRKFLFQTGFLVKSLVVDKKFGAADSSSPQLLDSYVGQYVLTFKGHDVTLQIDQGYHSSPVLTVILNHEVAMFILDKILTILNFRFNASSNHQPTPSSGRVENSTTPTRQTVCYL